MPTYKKYFFTAFLCVPQWPTSHLPLPVLSSSAQPLACRSASWSPRPLEYDNVQRSFFPGVHWDLLWHWSVMRWSDLGKTYYFACAYDKYWPQIILFWSGSTWESFLFLKEDSFLWVALWMPEQHPNFLKAEELAFKKLEGLERSEFF